MKLKIGFLLLCVTAVLSAAFVLETDVEFTHENPLHGKKSGTTVVVLPQSLDVPSKVLSKKAQDEDETHSLEEVRESSDSDDDSLISAQEDHGAAGALRPPALVKIASSRRGLFEPAEGSSRKTVSAHAQAMIAAATQALEEVEKEEEEEDKKIKSQNVESKKAERTWKQWFASWWFEQPEMLDRYQRSLKSMDTESLKILLDGLKEKLEETFHKQTIRQTLVTHYAGPKGLDLSVDVLGVDLLALQAALERKIKEMEFESEKDTMYSRILLVEIERLIELYYRSAKHLEDIEYKIECIEEELQNRTHLVKSKKRRGVIV